MVDNRPEDTGSLPESGRPKREPPTIDLDASEVSSETKSAGEAPSGPEAEPAPEVAQAPVEEAPVEESRVAEPPSRPVSPWVVAPVSGAVAAALVIGVGWMLGWPAIQPASVSQTAQLNAAAIDGLTAQIAGLESKVGKPVADPAAAARTDALEKSVATLRGELATARAQSEKLASAINEVKSAPRGDGTVSPDLAFAERIAKVESQMRAQSAEIAQQGSKLADTTADAKPADDMPLRRVVSAALLDVLVRIGDPYPTALAAAKALAPNPEALKALDEFAEKGVPNAGKLSTELLALVPKLLPAQQSAATTGTGIVDRLQAGAAKLVKIERTDTAGTDRGAVVARITAAALRNDFNEARRELKTLEPADRAAAQSWLESADARDAALAASRQFATEAMAVLAKPAQ
ncbi:COG4223 family protein [Bradyrhizobium sp. AZCC 1721]|uniref:COG4223 family protein n=1 Tax=Bradyrhizobium sp. AZCC 1721 TaxID=3117016 RepID=UPI002FF355DC